MVIELKKDQTSNKTVGQLLRYMGWVEKHLANGEEVRGIIIAAQYDQKMRYALMRLPDVDVFLYEVDFRLKEFEG